MVEGFRGGVNLIKDFDVARQGLVQVVKPHHPEGRVFVVGDLHGDYELFMEKLVLVDFDFEKDLVIAVGDLVDRGRANMQCIRLLDQPWFTSVQGNHEDFCCLGFKSDRVAEVHKDPRNGGAWFYSLPEEEQEGVVRKFLELPVAMEIDYKGCRYGFTHADIPITVWDELKTVDDPNMIFMGTGRTIRDYLIWSRVGYDTPDVDTEHIQGLRALFHGHTPTRGVIEKRGNEVYVDFGACFGYDLCLIELDKACEVVGL
jgi:serine/threonine protein phosphatase 1